MIEPRSPLVSVVIPTYNRGWCIERSVRSVLSQTERNVEAVIADDGSNDDTATRVQAMAVEDGRVRYEPLPGNRGVVAARDHGIQRARGRWILFLDSDDELLPHCVERFVAAAAQVADNPRVRILFADYCDTSTGRTKSRPGAFARNPSRYEDLVAQPFFGDLLSFVRRDLFDECPYRMAQRRVMQIVWFRLYRRADVYYLNETLALCHTQGSDRITRNREADAALWVDGMRQLIAEFGDDTARLCPRQLAVRLRILATMELAAGLRLAAIRSAVRALAVDVREWKALAVAAATLLPRRLGTRLTIRR